MTSFAFAKCFTRRRPLGEENQGKVPLARNSTLNMRDSRSSLLLYPISKLKPKSVYYLIGRDSMTCSEDFLCGPSPAQAKCALRLRPYRVARDHSRLGRLGLLCWAYSSLWVDWYPPIWLLVRTRCCSVLCRSAKNPHRGFLLMYQSKKGQIIIFHYQGQCNISNYLCRERHNALSVEDVKHAVPQFLHEQERFVFRNFYCFIKLRNS